MYYQNIGQLRQSYTLRYCHFLLAIVSKKFLYLIFLIVFLQTLVQCLYSFYAKAQVEELLVVFAYVFSAVFAYQLTARFTFKYVLQSV